MPEWNLKFTVVVVWSLKLLLLLLLWWWPKPAFDDVLKGRMVNFHEFERSSFCIIKEGIEGTFNDFVEKKMRWRSKKCKKMSTRR